MGPLLPRSSTRQLRSLRPPTQAALQQRQRRLLVLPQLPLGDKQGSEQPLLLHPAATAPRLPCPQWWVGWALWRGSVHHTFRCAAVELCRMADMHAQPPELAVLLTCSSEGNLAPSDIPCLPPMPPTLAQIHDIFSNIEAALAGRSFVPTWDRASLEPPHPGHPLVMAEALPDCDSGTEGGAQGLDCEASMALGLIGVMHFHAARLKEKGEGSLTALHPISPWVSPTSASSLRVDP